MLDMQFETSSSSIAPGSGMEGIPLASGVKNSSKSSSEGLVSRILGGPPPVPVV